MPKAPERIDRAIDTATQWREAQPPAHAVHELHKKGIKEYTREHKEYTREHKEYTREHKESHKCVFCGYYAIAQVGETDILLCYKCLHIIYEHLDPLRQFMECEPSSDGRGHREGPRQHGPDHAPDESGPAGIGP